MKVLKSSLIIFFIIIFLSSCTTDDSNPADINAQASDLVGTWNLIEENQNGTVSTLYQGNKVNGTITSTGKNLNTQITFTQNPNDFNATGNYTDVIKVSVLGITIVETEIDVPISDLIDQGTWSLDQGVLTFSQNGVQQNVRITELTSTILKIELDIENLEVNYPDYANTITINSTVKMTFTK